MKIHVNIQGQGYANEFDAVSHEIMGLPGGTYHVFKISKNRTIYINDFGIRAVQIDTI
jgi:hypothetical protein